MTQFELICTSVTTGRRRFDQTLKLEQQKFWENQELWEN